MENIIKLFIKVATFTHFKRHDFYNLLQGGGSGFPKVSFRICGIAFQYFYRINFPKPEALFYRYKRLTTKMNYVGISNPASERRELQIRISSGS